ncbi:DNA polymerase epsilon subunit 4 [Topomyia yanbarensis]|uniref:DNA polymerase epsilon subunit 4 n=1 Tax=Topomyia yanbarensis TaxID=2498891 RepID=UPI00273C68D0|nr:DNA polymerase epsilon subunit 4 [Topomyia yanbarensis]
MPVMFIALLTFVKPAENINNTMEIEVTEQSLKVSDENQPFIDSEEINFGSEPDESESQQNQVSRERIEDEVEDVNISIDEEAQEVIEENENLDNVITGLVDPSTAASAKNTNEPSEPRLVNFPLSKVKQIMKFDPDVHIVTAEAIFLVARAAELFAQTLVKEAHTHTTARKKKTIAKSDVDATVESVDTLMFLEGMMSV